MNAEEYNKQDQQGLMALVDALQRSVRELQDQAQVPDAG